MKSKKNDTGKDNLSIDELRDVIGPIAAESNITAVSLFGSRATGQYTPSSDYDFIVDTNDDFTFHDYCKFKDRMMEILDSDIDIIYRSTLRDDIFGRKVRREEIHVWS